MICLESLSLKQNKREKMNTNNQLHLIKLAVGVETIEELKAYQVKYSQKQPKKKKEFIHVTRHMPKRAEELLNGGSLYWVIKGYVRVRQRIVELRELVVNDVRHCGIVLTPTEVIQTALQPRRPFQGWRYLTADKAPNDVGGDGDISDMPEAMLRELTELGLL